jgi:hypothetical protein
MLKLRSRSLNAIRADLAVWRADRFELLLPAVADSQKLAVQRADALSCRGDKVIA